LSEAWKKVREKKRGKSVREKGDFTVECQKGIEQHQPEKGDSWRSSTKTGRGRDWRTRGGKPIQVLKISRWKREALRTLKVTKGTLKRTWRTKQPATQRGIYMGGEREKEEEGFDAEQKRGGPPGRVGKTGGRAKVD